ncbi:hypothetical protein GALMADRAFT_225370 [Galerina marginata CBS 339.88]|uniref:Uncharacterized protein n=1 Tax=Galerina marginata (strain CBS 339.88) TaxID=685588 RepID=A0A067T236_GALM3|nr:hypothetical protein GALMADRAFT_225370 [Galerina marginata CBS 339.88]
MVLRPNFAKHTANQNENHPPARTLNSKALVSRIQSSLHDTSHRRRSRISGMTRTPKYAVEQAKRRNTNKAKTSLRFNVTTVPTLADVEMADGSSTSSVPRPRAFPISLPKELGRPDFKEINREIIDAVDPTLAETDLDYLRENLEVLGPELIQSLSNVKVNAVKDKLPKELTIVVNDMTTILPTHLLAVFGKQSNNASSSKPRKVTLFPVHSLVLATTCANLPKPPSALPVPVHETGHQEAELPVWSLCLPSPVTYPQLSTYLYTKQINHLMRSMLPCMPPPAFLENPSQLVAFATHLSATFTIQALVKHIFAVHGLWQNVCALGIFDSILWEAMDLMWQTLLTALAIATGNPNMMIPPPAEEVPQSSSLTVNSS